MRNIIVLVLLIGLFLLSLVNEPMADIIDTFAGASTETFSPGIDGEAGVSLEHEDDDDEDEEEDEYEDHEEDEEEDDD